MNKNKRIDKMRSTEERSSERKPRNKSRRTRQSKDVTTKVENPIISQHEHHNYAAWYIDNPELLDQASRLSFQSIAGTGVNDIGVQDALQIPTTQILYLNPCPGVTHCTSTGTTLPSEYDYKSAGINLAAFKLFTQLSMQSGRTASYAPQDITTLLLQIGELISQIEWGRRFFGIAFTYNDRNRVWPKDMVDMLGIDSTDFFSNLADYRMKMNTSITRVKQIPIPANIKYFEKCEYLYQTGYLDSQSPLAQVYIFNPASTWLMDETYAQGTALTTVSVTLDHTTGSIALPGNVPTTVRRTFQDWLDNVLDPMIDALLTSSTLNVIYADILNYVGRAGIQMWSFDYISEAYSIAPTFAPDMLEIIHNIVPVGALPSHTSSYDRATSRFTTYNDVYPDVNNNSLIYYPEFAYNTTWRNMAITDGFDDSIFEYSIVDLQDPNAGIDTRIDVLEYRAMPYKRVSWTDNDPHVDWILPDHYCVGTRIFSDYSHYANCSTYGTGQWATVSLNYRSQAVFDWHPICYEVVKNAGGSNLYMQGILLSDVNFYTSVDSKYLARLLKLSYLGLFNLRNKS